MCITPNFTALAKKPPNSLVLSADPPGITLLHANNVVLTNANEKTSPQLLRLKLEAHNRTLRTKVDARSKKTQQLYEHDYNLRVRRTPVLKPYDLAFVARPPVTAIKESDESSIATCAYNTFLRRTLGPFRVISVQSYTITIS